MRYLLSSNNGREIVLIFSRGEEGGGIEIGGESGKKDERRESENK